MKILDNRKDYYDYLTGTYGIDLLLVLDRRNHDNFTLYNKQKLIFYICGMQIEGYFDGKKFYYGDNLRKFGEPEKRYLVYYNKDRFKDMVYIKEIDTYVATKLINLSNDKNYNKIYDCPILLQGYLSDHFIKYPQLSKYSLQQILPAPVIYQLLINYLSDIRNQNESKSNNRSDNEKIVSKGFNIKRSFRPNMK